MLSACAHNYSPLKAFHYFRRGEIPEEPADKEVLDRFILVSPISSNDNNFASENQPKTYAAPGPE